MVDDLSHLEVSAYGEVIHFTVGVGVAEMVQIDETGADVLRRADQGLEDAIEEGRGIAVFETPPQTVSGIDGSPGGNSSPVEAN